MTSAMPAIEIFKKLSEELSSLLENEGLAVRPYSHPSLSHFQQLSTESQTEIIKGLSEYIEASRRVLRAGRSLKEIPFFVATALEFFGFETHPEFDRRLPDFEGVVEFYAFSGNQLFRTLNYFEMTSYTLEDMYCRQWNYLYERDEALSKKMYEDFERLIQSQDPNAFAVVGPHQFKERISLERLEIRCDGMLMSPLTRQGKVVALAALTACRPLERSDR